MDVSKLDGYGQNRRPVCGRRYHGHRAMGAGDPVKFFSLAFLVEGKGSQNGSHNHSRSVDPGQNLVQTYGTARFRPRNPGGADGIVSAEEIQVAGCRSASQSGPAVGRTGALAPGEWSAKNRCDDGYRRD